MSECDEIISLDSDRKLGERLLYKRGVHQYDAGKLKEAEQSFLHVLKKNRSDGAAHNNLGLVYFRMRKLPEAAKEFEAAAELLPASGVPWNNLGLVLESAGSSDESLEYYAHANQLEPRNPEFLGNLVRTQIRRGDRGPEVVEMLQSLSYIETRPEWVAWVQRQLNLEQNLNLDRGPSPTQFRPQSNLTGPSDQRDGTSPPDLDATGEPLQYDVPTSEILLMEEVNPPAPIISAPSSVR